MFIHCSADKCVYMMLMPVAPSAQHKLVLQHLILFPLKQSLLAQALPPPQLITLTRANRTNAHFCQSGWLGQGLKKGLSRPKQDTWSPYHSLPHKGSELCRPFSWHCCLPPPCWLRSVSGVEPSLCPPVWEGEEQPLSNTRTQPSSTDFNGNGTGEGISNCFLISLAVPACDQFQ